MPLQQPMHLNGLPYFYKFNYNNNDWLTCYETAPKYHCRDVGGDKKITAGIFTRMPSENARGDSHEWAAATVMIF